MVNGMLVPSTGQVECEIRTVDVSPIVRVGTGGTTSGVRMSGTTCRGLRGGLAVICAREEKQGDEDHGAHALAMVPDRPPIDYP
jgi:hypothetical protein